MPLDTSPEALQAELADLKRRNAETQRFLSSEECQALPRLEQQLHSERWRCMVRLEQCVAAMLRKQDERVSAAGQLA